MLLFSYLSFQFIGANILFFSFVKQIHAQNIYCKHKKRFDEMSCSKKNSPQAEAHGEINRMMSFAIHHTVFMKRQCRFRH